MESTMWCCYKITIATEEEKAKNSENFHLEATFSGHL
jgi:hypothetical protein